jgi:ABC-type Mn2+/Zn2+ transport system ATPase subunit
MAASGNSSGLEIANLRVAYGSRLALDDVCLCCRRGEIVGLLGPNGSGKSTLLKSVLSLVPKLSGAVNLDGQPLEGARQKIRVAYVPQRNDVVWDFPINVEEVVLLGCQGRLGLCGRPGTAERAAAHAALERMDMSDYRRVQIGELSGGQQQRVFLARALAQGCDTLLLDEPLSGVDATTQEVVLGLLAELRASGRSVIIATHDLSQAARLCDELCLLHQRVVACGPPDRILNPTTLTSTYGAHAVLNLAEHNAVFAEDGAAQPAGLSR